MKIMNLIKKIKVIMFGPSSINWCELDYVYSEYIAEYWNTWTGLFLCASSIYALIKNFGHKTLYYSNFLLFMVGIGTMMFHGTLIYIWQLLDEIPMMLIVIEYYRILANEIFITHYIRIKVIDYYILYYCIPFIILSYYIYPKLQVILFQGTLAVCIVSLLYTCYMININLNKIFYTKNPFNYTDDDYVIRTSQTSESDVEILTKCKRKGKRLARKTYIYNNDNIVDKNNSLEEFKKYLKVKKHITYHNYQGLSLLFFSLLIWNIDNHYCQQYIPLHAIWHITTSIGMYSCNEIIRSYILLNKQLVQKQ